MIPDNEEDMHMKTVTFDYYPGGRKKALTMSYDDGNTEDRRLIEIFNKYGIRGTFHLNAGFLDSGAYISGSEIKELYRGHEVSAHGFRHPFLTQIPRKAVAEEILEDRRKLESYAGYPVRGMSYPFGDFNDELLTVLPWLGIEYSRTVLDHGNFLLPANFLTWHPTCHHKGDVLGKLGRFENSRPWERMPLFYVWGHSFEFERENNWIIIEEFCRAASGNPDVWYATNVEIMDYVLAMRNLKLSVGNTQAYNPSSLSIWIGVDGEAVEIKPGELLTL